MQGLARHTSQAIFTTRLDQITVSTRIAPTGFPPAVATLLGNMVTLLSPISSHHGASIHSSYKAGFMVTMLLSVFSIK